MKNIYFVIMVMACNFSFSQDTRLFENYWYLRKVTIDAVDHLPPTTMGIEFQDSSMLLMGCLPMPASPTFENNWTNFSAADFSPCLCWCTDPEAQAYENIYFSMFIGDDLDLSATRYFTYAISEANDERTLTINSIDGKQAFYSNIMLSTSDVIQLDYSIFPNPATNHIVVKSDSQNIGNSVINFYNELGILSKSVEFNNVETNIDLGDLSAGIYFVKIKSDLGTITKKLVKI